MQRADRRGEVETAVDLAHALDLLEFIVQRRCPCIVGIGDAVAVGQRVFLRRDVVEQVGVFRKLARDLAEPLFLRDIGHALNIVEGADLVADARRRSGVGVIFEEDLDLIKIGDVFKIIVNIFGNQRKAADKEKAADKDKDADKGEQPVAHHAVQRL